MQQIKKSLSICMMMGVWFTMFVFPMDRVSADIFDSIKIEDSSPSDGRKQTVDLVLLKGATGHALSIQFNDNKITGLIDSNYARTLFMNGIPVNKKIIYDPFKTNDSADVPADEGPWKTVDISLHKADSAYCIVLRFISNGTRYQLAGMIELNFAMNLLSKGVPLTTDLGGRLS